MCKSGFYTSCHCYVKSCYMFVIKRKLQEKYIYPFSFSLKQLTIKIYISQYHKKLLEGWKSDKFCLRELGRCITHLCFITIYLQFTNKI